ncbi:hypothetical protein P3T37_005116 [Kitasatospora sp. MAA4]|uniref:hypothetical protein n=1 Tax=Kitasatospora sp. MAA4 TaxID=3035093 RepID=UPI0024768912|nr:hypothetical protein [Kitasatospora sp. MAA4]MDH6135699.1 hypothetical protein [Kitasatospora sp. MAA4]
MQAIVTSMVAVLGTLLGSTVTHVFQQRSARRAEQGTREEKRRKERMEAYTAYAGLLVKFRQAELHHWFCVNEGTDAEDEVQLRQLSYELRSATQHALFQLQMITDEPALVAVAKESFRQTGKIDRAQDRADVITRRDLTRDLIDDFVDTAKSHVQGEIP